MDDGVFATLPRGRHTLTRDQVEAAQRGRLLLGMVAVVAEKGYPATTVADVLKRAHISRDTFYRHFTGKEDCFLAALDQSAAVVSSAVEERLRQGRGAPLARVDAALGGYLATLAARADVAKVFFLESFAAGAAARRTRFEVQERFVAVVAAALADDPAWARVPDREFACRVIVAAVGSMVTAALAEDRAGELPGLREPIMELVAHLGS